MYEDVVAFLQGRENQKKKNNDREKMDGRKVAGIRRRYPGIPEDYLQYLKEVGPGSFLNCWFMVYSGFIEPSFIFGDDLTHLDESILCFGDNFSGDAYAFDRRTWKIVEIDHVSREVGKVKGTFGEFIRERMGIAKKRTK